MTIQLTGPVVNQFNADPAIEECLKDSKHKRRPEFMEGKPKLKTTRCQTVELSVAGDKFMER